MKVLILSLVLVLASSCNNVIMSKGTKLRDKQYGKPGACDSYLDKDFTEENLKNDQQVRAISSKDPKEFVQLNAIRFNREYMKCEKQ